MTRVYVRLRGGAPHEYEWQHGSVLRRVNEPDPHACVVVQLADGRLVEANEEQDVLVANELPEGCASLADVENLDALTHLHEASFVDYLKHRYEVDQVYCKSGAVLIAVNPFKDIAGLYDMYAYRERIHGRGGGVAVQKEEQQQQRQEQPDEEPSNAAHGSNSSSAAASAVVLPPHVFSIAESAYRSLRQAWKLRSSDTKRDQTILVSGESGAGKTETTKFVMNYLANVSSSSGASTEEESGDCDRIPGSGGMSGSQLMSANPILESFGNARTLRNDNSSRFGKFVRMFFGSSPRVVGRSINANETPLVMVGTSVDTYLLEKVRVIHQTQGERNYHIFYELLAGADDALKRSLHLQDLKARDFQYVKGGNCFHRNDGVQDAVQFKRVLESMQILGFTQDEQSSLWKTLSALLHLGNVSFIPSTDDEDETNSSATAPCRLALKSPSSLSPAKHLECVAELLGVEQEQFLSALTTRKINISGECFQVNLSQAQCSDARDAMARSMYGFLFQFLVTKINVNSPQQTQQQQQQQFSSFGGNYEDEANSLLCIAVLDIFGFEEFDVNLFEQFCINYANEKLQYQFIQDILLTEQQAHIQEGIKWNAIDYQDNSLCLEMLEQRPNGIFSLLDEECIIPKGSDPGFARKMYLQLAQNVHFSASRKEQVDFTFTIHHYAGQVQYDARGFCEKNKDQPNAELFTVLNESRDEHLSDLFRSFVEAEHQRLTMQQPKLRRRSSVIGAVGIASQFKQQLAGLIEVVQQTQTHYIRCIKPNDVSARNQFDLPKVASQLRYGGVLKAVEIMRQSFPVRMPHGEFVKQYKMLFARDSTNYNDRVLDLVQKLKIDQVEVGRTRVFLRQNAFDELEKRRDRLRLACLMKIQSNWKAIIQRQRYLKQVVLIKCVQVRWKAILELKRRKLQRDRAVHVLQSASRRWIARVRCVRYDAVMLLQRAVRTWSRKLAARKSALMARSPSSTSAETEIVEKSFGESLAELKAPTVEIVERGSTATYSIESSSYSEDPADDLPLELTMRSTMNSSVLMFDEVARAPENIMLRQALEELERLRYRAEAAEAALAQIATDGRGVQASTSRVLGGGHPAAFANRLESSFASESANPTTPRLTHNDRTNSLNARSEIAMDVYGNTALHHAIAAGDVERALAMLTSDELRGIVMLQHAENQQGFTPLHMAVKSGNTEMVGLFFRPDVLPHVDLDCGDRDGNTALHLASQLNFELADRVMELLLCFGASSNATNFLKQTPLHLCAMIKRSGASSMELMEKLLRNGGDPQKIDFLKRTPLHYCIEKGMEDEAILLMRHGADMNIPDGEGIRVVTHPKATNLLRYLRVTPSWIPDADVNECMVCLESFSSFFSRKQHCDRCGRICCTDCSSASSSWKGRFCFDCKHYQHVA